MHILVWGQKNLKIYEISQERLFNEFWELTPPPRPPHYEHIDNFFHRIP